MDKNEILTHLRESKSSHINWVNRAKMLINGFNLDEDAIPINSTECKFGQWFYTDAQKLNALQNNPLECMSSIEEYHTSLHDSYMHIFKIYYQSDDRGLFSKFFGGKKKISDAEKELVEKSFSDMLEVSNKLLTELNRMERRIIAIQDSEIEKIN